MAIAATLFLSSTSLARGTTYYVRAALGITGSAVAGLESDDGTVDLGYHYGADDLVEPRHRGKRLPS